MTCGKCAKEVGDFRIHARNHHRGETVIGHYPDGRAVVANPKTPKSVKICRVDGCNRKFTSSALLISHLRDRHPKTFRQRVASHTES